MGNDGFLVEDILDIIEPVCMVCRSTLDGFTKRLKTIVPFELDELLSGFADIALVLDKFFKIRFDRIP